MSKFQQAIQWMKEGRKVRRSSISNKSWYIFLSEKQGEEGFVYLHHTKMAEPSPWHQSIKMLGATDWEIYEEEIKLEKRSFSERVAYIKTKFDVGVIGEETYKMHIAAIMEGSK